VIVPIVLRDYPARYRRNIMTVDKGEAPGNGTSETPRPVPFPITAFGVFGAAFQARWAPKRDSYTPSSTWDAQNLYGPDGAPTWRCGLPEAAAGIEP